MTPSDFVILLVFVGALWQFIHILFSKTPEHNLPPGPPGLPFIGHLHMLGKLPHRTLFKLSQKYGPIMSIRLGLVPTVIVSSPAAAELFLKTHDTVFASRPSSQASDYLFYGTTGIGFTKYGAHWRSARKLCMLELLNAEKVKSMAGMRREDLRLCVESLKKAAASREVVDISEKVVHLIEDMTCRMLFGKSRDERFDLSAIVHDIAEDLGAFNIADYIPFLGALNLQGFTKRFQITSEAVDKILETMIDGHEKDVANGYKKNDRDFLDVILALKKNPTGTHEQLARNLNQSNIKAILMDLIFGAIDASPTAIEWTMSELIRNPRVMKLLQEEIRDVTHDLPRANHLLAIPTIHQR
ncbi:putative flavonoid 3'-monooxygenase [Heracleum sosnowskyi]|uniref:Flavonoid 3'-monooxygenase n=1 Tax=Heracleum sosnowskyi TaxID=360622 RepID=A0AAD8IY75_9APIA|nr:putative flavonoid 3'-monooxygenase [Heracleum sosnowskyi]